MAGRSTILILLLALELALLFCPAEGKFQTGILRRFGGAGQERWQYLDKFGYTLGPGDYEFRVRLRGPQAQGEAAPQLDLEVFLDEEWDLAESLPVCQRALEGPARKIHRVPIGRPGEWGSWEAGRVIQVMRPHIWYFALSSCTVDGVYDIDYELRMRQFDDGELSIELRFMPSVSILALICLSAFSARFASRCRNLRQTIGRLHPVIQGLAMSVALQWVSQALHAVHFWVYRISGVGAHRIDFVAEVAFTLSQVVSSTLLISISQGYTLSRSNSEAKELGLVKPIAACVAILHVVLVGLGKMQGDASYKYHDNEGAVGLALLAVRLLLCTWFISGVQSLQGRGCFKLQTFLQRFKFAGSLYFLSYPGIFAVVQLFAQYLQHPIMQIGMLAMQTTSAFWLANLFLSRGAYFEVSELSSSLLPGGAGFSFAIEIKKED